MSPEQLEPLGEQKPCAEENELEHDRVRGWIEGSDLLSREQKEELEELWEENPTLVDLESKAIDLAVPIELLEQFQEDRQAIVTEFLEGTEDHVRDWFENNLADIQNKERTIAACVALEKHIIEEKGQAFIDGQVDSLDLSAITIEVTIAQYQTADGNQASSAIKIEVQGYTQSENKSSLISEQQEDEMDSAKEMGNYQEKTM